MGIFAAFIPDAEVELIGVEAGGEGIETPRHGAPLTVGGRAGILHGSRSAVMQDEEGQIIQAHSISAGLDYPGAGPEHAHLRDSGRARYVAVNDRDAVAAFHELARLEGIIPALETAHALAWALAQREGELDLVCLSGRGDKDLAEVMEQAGAVSTLAMSGVQRIADAFAHSAKRAALMPYVMAGFPTLEESIRIGEACVQSGADVIELGVPYSDPLADGPVIHAAGTQALTAGASMSGVLEVARALADSVPVVLMCYANMVFAPGVEAFVERLARTGACGLIVPDLPLGEAPEVLEACDRHGLALVALVAPTTTPERMAAIGAQARGFLYTVSVVGTTGERSALAESFAEVVTRAKASTRCPSRSVSGSPPPSRRPGGRRGRRRRDRGHAPDPCRRRGRGSRRGGWRARRRAGRGPRRDRPARIPRAWD